VGLARGQAREVEPLFRKVIEARRTLNRKDNWALFDAESLLGDCLTLQGRFPEAEPLLLKSFDAMKANHAVPHRVRAARERIVRLYQAWGKPEQAARWRDNGGTAVRSP
jgi:hypothetical protein